MTEKEPEVSFEFIVRNSTLEGEVRVREIYPGLHPIILIEPVEDEDGNFKFVVDSTDLDFAGMKWLFETAAGLLAPHVEEE